MTGMLVGVDPAMRPRADLDDGLITSGKGNTGCRVGWNDDHHLDVSILNRPRTLGHAIGGHVPRASRGEPTTWMWSHSQVAISRSGRRQPPHGTVQPVSDGSQSVVIERGHLAWIDRAICKQAIPALPDSGGSHRHWIEPRRAFALHEQVKGRVVVSNTAQCITHQRRSYKTRADVIPAPAHEFDQPLTCMLPLLSIFKQTELQR